MPIDPNRYNYSNRFRSRNTLPTPQKPAPVFQYRPPETKKDDGFFMSTMRETWDYILTSVLKPNIKRLIDSLFTGAKDMMLWGGNSAPTNSWASSTPASSSTAPWMRTSAQKKPWLTDIPIPNRESAKEILNRMYQYIIAYGKVTVADVYNFMGMTSEFPEESAGWCNCDGFNAKNMPDGYWYLILPDPFKFQ